MDELRTIARPYAKAVFDVAAASSSLTEWSDFLKQCSSLLANNEIKALIKALAVLCCITEVVQTPERY